ncbi:MAG: hypothetical protein EXR91_11335 [Gemmatimonadetes bacterium]|nr:hypothetical protein [Gemmatimonadota bacterium]
MPGRHRTLSLRSLLLATLLATFAQAVAGQAGRVATEDNFRREPNGVVLGRLSSGTPLQVIGRQDNWLQADVEGWVWLASLQPSDTELDLVVSVTGGENLRSGPQGTIVGRLEEGALLEEIGRETGWAHVRRRGWIWSASVAMGAGAPAPAATRPAGPAPATAQAPRQALRPGPAAQQPSGYASVGPGGAAILASPDGDTLALAVPERDLQVVSRDGNWVRVRLDGWVWMPQAAQASSGTLDTTPSTLVPQDLTANPSEHAGRVVAWGLQFISLERAEAIRTDFRQGEPFLLTRYGGPEGPFVYVAVPPERLTDVEGLVPLERITVTARVRTGASSLTGTPIVDLLSFERLR